MKILVTGGAGYIGSHTAKWLAKHEKEFLVFDNLSRGHEWAVKWSHFVHEDLGNREAVVRTLRDNKIDAVIHFAAHSQVGESMVKPEIYFRNNVMNTMTLLEAMKETGVKYIIFSSTAAVYGNPETTPIDENHPKRPVNPYGESKLMMERTLHWYGEAHGLKWMALRYFNAAGADPDGEIGEDHTPESHLIPIVLEALLGRRDPVQIFGTDYPTPDGTAVRDYIHVTDLADAHLRALNYLADGGKSGALNLGTGTGYSVREVIQTAEKVSGKKVPAKEGPRRAGDPPVLVAAPGEAGKLLGWKPQYSSIETVVETALRWHEKRVPKKKN